MNAEEIIRIIQTSKKQTTVKVYFNAKEPIPFPETVQVFGHVAIGPWEDIQPVLEAQKDNITNLYMENDGRNTAIPLLDTKNINARIEPGAIIRDNVEIGDHAVIMMGAVINIGAQIGENTMIDMGAVLGGRAIVKNNCHIGAGAVLAGVVEPASATPVIVEDNVLIGANAGVIEGVHIGKGAVIGAGAIVLEDVGENQVVGGNPARVIKAKNEQTEEKTGLVDALRQI